MTPAAPPSTADAPAARRLRIGAPPLPPLPAWQLGIGAFLGLLVGVLSGQPLLAVVLAAGVPFILVTSLRTKILTYFVVLPLIGALKYQFPHASVQSIPHLVSISILLQMVLMTITNRVKLPVRHPLVVMAFGYAIIVIVQAMTPLAQAAGVGASGIALYLEPFVLFLAGLIFWRDLEAPKLFLRVGVVTAFLVGLYMMKQLIFGFSHAELAFQAARFNVRGVGEQRLFSTLSGPAAYAFVTVVFMLLCLAGRVSGLTPRRLTVAAGTLSAIGIVASGTRIAVIGAVPALAMLLALIGTSPGGRQFAKRVAAIAFAIAVLLLAVVAVTPVQQRNAALHAANPVQSAVVKLAMLKAGGADDDIAGRVRRFNEFTTYMRRHPWGAGTGAVQIIQFAGPQQAGTLHAEPPLPELLRDQPWIFQRDFYYFSVGVELGLIPMFLYLTLFSFGTLFALGGRWREYDPGRRMVLGLSATVVGFALIHNLTNESFRTPQVSAYVWFLLAAPIALAVLRREEAAAAGRDRRPPAPEVEPRLGRRRSVNA